MKNKSVVTVIIAMVVCLALVLSFFLGRKSAEQEKQPAIPTATVQATTVAPTETPNFTITEEPTLTPKPTIVYAPDMGNYDLLSAYIFEKIQQGPLKRYEVLWYIEETGIEYNYVTLVLRDSDYNFTKVVVVLKEDKILDIFFLDSEGCFNFYHLEEDNYIPIQETDVNFDGKTDVLIFRGAYGNVCYNMYSCYLGTEDGLVHCPSFDYIADPEVNAEKQFIRSWSRESAVEHAGSIYKFIDDAFVMTEKLSVKYDEDAAGNPFDKWTLEQRIDGEWVVTGVFSEEGMTDAEKEDLWETLKTFDSYYSLFSE